MLQAVCVFVSDQVTPKVARALKDSGVEMIALRYAVKPVNTPMTPNVLKWFRRFSTGAGRCAGFDFVDIKVNPNARACIARPPAIPNN